jgi:hypothetical protein
MRNTNHIGDTKVLKINVRFVGNRNASHFMDAGQRSSDASGDAVLPISLRAGSRGLASIARSMADHRTGNHTFSHSDTGLRGMHDSEVLALPTPAK